MYVRGAAAQHPSHTTRCCRSRPRPATRTRGRSSWRTQQMPAVDPSRWESSRTRRARSRSWASPTPTWPGWSIGDINAKGGLLGRQLELYLEDSATDDAVAAAKAAKLVEHDQVDVDLRRHLQLHEAGDQGAGRRRGQDALHLSRAVRGAGVRSAHLLHRPGAGAAGRPVHPVADASRPARRRSTCRRPTTSGRTC